MGTGGRRHHEDGVEYYRRLPDSPVTAFAFGPTTVSLDLIANNGILMGWAATETTGAAACAFDLMDGADDGGSLLAPVVIAQGASAQRDFTSWGVWVQRGVRIKVLSGSVRGVVYFVLPGDTAGR